MFYEIEPKLTIGIFRIGERVVPIFKETPEGISVRKGWMDISSRDGSIYAKEFNCGWRCPRLQVFIQGDARDTIFIRRHRTVSGGWGWISLGIFNGDQITSHHTLGKRLRWISDTP